jgi:tetratricopeptide (TPR) repeat protein
VSPRSSDDALGRTLDEVEAITSQFLAQLQAGEKPDREALVRAHPHLADRLGHRLALAELICQVGLAQSESRTGAGGQTCEPAAAAAANGGRPTTMTADVASPAWPKHPGDLPNYEILGTLGHGGMGIVYKARQKSLNRVVALKMIGAGAHASPELLTRFHIEAESLASLQHPGIVSIYDVGEHEGCPYLAMEYLDAGSLATHLAGQPQDARVSGQLVEALARAMHAAHVRGIVHRDLKPENVLLQGTASIRPGTATACGLEGLVPKITDFGLAKRFTEGGGQTATGAIVGTPAYMAPEQACGRVHDIGPATDVYSLGAMLYEMLTGLPPFCGDSPMDTLRQVMFAEPAAPSRLRRRLPSDLETICLKCLEKEPARRYATADRLADDLRRFLDGRPIAARPARLGERAWKWAKRRPAWATLIAVVLSAAALLLASFGWSYARVRTERDLARRNYQVAREAIEGLYTKMATERLFDEPQLDPLCQELLERARELYEGLAAEQSDDPDVRREVAQAWFHLGEIHRMGDDHDQAERAYREAIARQEELSRDYPDRPRYRQDLANSNSWLGELLRESGHLLEKAERHHRVALKLQQGLVTQDANEPAYQVGLARSHYNLGIIERESARPSQARHDYDQAVARLTQLQTDRPGDANYRQDLARALINRGILHRQDGRPQEAGRDYDRAIQLLEGLRQELPARAAFKFEMAIARQDRGNLIWSQGRQADARREHAEALRLLSELVADYATRTHYQKKKANVLKNLGTVLAYSGMPREAEVRWTEARAIFEGLAGKFPEGADYQGLLGMTLGNLGWLRTEEAKWREALPLIQASIERLQVALQPNPLHPDYREELRTQYQNLGWTLLQLRDDAATVRAAKNLAGVFPQRAQDSYYAACLIARCIPLAKDPRLARTYLHQSVGLLRAAAAKAPPDLKRIPDEQAVFRLADFHDILRDLDRKMAPPGKPGA